MMGDICAGCGEYDDGTFELMLLGGEKLEMYCPDCMAEYERACREIDRHESGDNG